MKKIIKYTVLAALAFSTTSCSFLNVDESIGATEEYMFSYFDEVKKTVSHIYGFMQDDYAAIDGAMREAATDNAVHVWSDSKINDTYNDSWSAINNLEESWSHYYSGIRAANNFLETFNLDRFEKFKYNDSFENQFKMAELYPDQVRFLRAYFYFELLKRYRNIPLVTKVLDQGEVNSLEQAPCGTVVDFIVTECDEVMENLPANYQNLPGKETGRITKGACMALKARTLLYAASPLFNEAQNVEAKYEKAVSAAWDLISYAKNSSAYAIVASEQLWGNGNSALMAKQLILEKRNPDANKFEKNNTAMGFEGGNTGTCPSQNLIDALPNADGSAFDWNDPAMAASPYANRDPRLGELVLYNGSVWKNQQVETFENGRNGAPLYGASITGYYLRKHMNEQVELRQGNETTVAHHFPLFRYAEVLLNYAEALNEWKGPDYTDGTYTMTAVDALNEVRKRTGAAALAGGLSQESFRTICRNERRVELAFEDHRFWDIRRWMIGPETTDIYGIKVTKNGEDTTYERILVQQRVWKDKMYLYPIPQNEILKNNHFKQNPGW